MVKIIMVGCNGRMGKVITDLVVKDTETEIVAGVDIFDDGHNDYPVFANIADVNVEADAIIDFSSPKLLDGILDFAISKNMPVVMCTTGYSDEELAKINEASKKIAVLRSGNMSLGINTLVKKHLLIIIFVSSSLYLFCQFIRKYSVCLNFIDNIFMVNINKI